MEPEVAPKQDRLCPKCRHEFRDPSTLRRHTQRKRSCAPVVALVRTSQAQHPGGRESCRFCGRTYSSEWNLRRHLKSCPIAARGTAGLDALYAHVLAQSVEVEELRTRLAQTQLAVPDGQHGDTNVFITMSGVTLDARVTNIVSINVFGQETTDHISPDVVRGILARYADLDLGTDDRAREAVVRAVLEAALLIYSDSTVPNNVTCYLPSQRGDNALIHGAEGWEMVPVRLVLGPMARASFDLFFDKQPLGDDVDRFRKILQEMRRCEQQVTASGAGLQAVLIRNKDILARLLEHLPVAGSSNRAPRR